MTDTQTSSPGAPMPVLSYQPAVDPSEVAAIHWWVLCGGVIFGVAATASQAARLGVDAITRLGPAARWPLLSPDQAARSATMLLCDLAIAGISFAAMRRKMSQSLAAWLLLISALTLAGAELSWIVTFPVGQIPFLQFMASLLGSVQSFLWPIVMSWILLSRVREDNIWLLHRWLVVAAAAIGASIFLMYLLNLSFYLSDLRWTWRRIASLPQVVVSLVAAGLITILCIAAASSSKPDRRRVRMAFIAFAVLVVVGVAFRLRDTLASPSDPIRQGLAILAAILRNCAAGVAIFVPLMVLPARSATLPERRGF